MDTKNPHPIDVYVGSRVKQRRKQLKMSQSKLGEPVGLTFQQIQKYERGTNRMGSSRLHQFSKVLDVPISFFFDDMPADVETRVVKGYMPSFDRDDIMSRDETLELIRLYYGLESPQLRLRFRELVKALAYSTDEETH